MRDSGLRRRSGMPHLSSPRTRIPQPEASRIVQRNDISIEGETGEID
jgi:hypothetical protein